MQRRQKPNALCNCNSGRKHKHCCMRLKPTRDVKCGVCGGVLLADRKNMAWKCSKNCTIPKPMTMQQKAKVAGLMGMIGGFIGGGR